MGQGQTAQVVLTVDVALFCQWSDRLHVLLIQRGKDPYQGYWALPGGKLDGQDPTVEDAAVREVQEETGVVLSSRLHQVGTFGNVGRDPRGRYVSVLYMAVIEPYTEKRAGDDAAAVVWCPLSLIPAHVHLAFDHEILIASAYRRLCEVQQW